ncbi:MAG: hypothetical protein FJ095_08890 [Deltaproteobacteria bacterium]|nr:hypothetical protein [Deltaproteobacteria bacterium]
MKVFVRGQGSVALEPGDFVARGGQASIYAKGDVAFKIFTDPTAMVPVGKLQELAAIRDPDVVRPDALVQDESTGRALGYTMRYLRDTRSLCQVIPPAYRQRHGLDANTSLALVERLRQVFVSVHQAGALVVDANELNFLVDARHARVFAIDVDSYETRSYPASAITPAIQDPLGYDPRGTPVFSEASDWFSFAVLAFELFIGAHPYRGSHPEHATLLDRMKHHASAFDPRVKLAPSALPLDVIPAPYRDYLHAVLQEGARDEAPPCIAASPAEPRPFTRPVAVGGSASLSLDMLITAPSRVRAVHELGDGTVRIECHDALLDGEGRRLADLAPERLALVFSPRYGRPVTVERRPRGLALYDVDTQSYVEPPGQLDEVTVGGGRLFGRVSDSLLELALLEVGGSVIVTPRLVARVWPRATRLFPGLAVQSLLGASYLSLLGSDGGARQLRVRELDGYRLVDAHADRAVVVALVADAGRLDRLTLRVDPSTGSYDARWSRDVDADVPDLVVLDRGLCLAKADPDRLEVYAATPGALELRTLEDPRLGELRLARSGGAALAFRGESVYRLSSRA